MLLSATFFVVSAARTFAADPLPAPVVPLSAGLACPGFQRCGDHCLPWTAVCRDTLADSVGLTPPPILPSGAHTPPANATLGSTLLALPGTREAGRAIMRPGGPAFCYDGKTTSDLSVQMACVPYYSVGAASSSVRTGSALADCPHHRRCGGVCLGETEVCMDENKERDSDRLTPFEQ